MSSIQTKICILEDVRPHPNADRLNIGQVGGWQVCLLKDTRKTGDLIVYFEPGTVMTQELADRLDVTKYLSNKTDINGCKRLVVGKIKLRGEPSFGLCIPADDVVTMSGDPEKVVFLDDDVSDLYGTDKFHPPVKAVAGDAAPDDPTFPKYTDIENLRNFSTMFEEGEIVEVTEKLHGTNSRVGFTAMLSMGCEADGTIQNGKTYGLQGYACLKAGSRALCRKDPGIENREANTYWYPHTLNPVKAAMQAMFEKNHSSFIIYGEIYGAGVQKGFDYGLTRPGFRAFDIMVDGKYVDREVFEGLCNLYEIETVPSIYTGPYSLAKIAELSEGDAIAGGRHIREGVVVRPMRERSNAKTGRTIAKYISNSYLFGVPDSEDTTDQ